ncbi:hypothetical protein P170DRAFT_473515 [Aspergillus steynii IBT 23096]|uniref:Uncharacterized protein n=1 Tax=Aspergillus steynii IBT 23096 TaxID=1392250 RepID=A0A2I2GAP6_9EURO|nr:uncharacterized protein P170DRAFT_473515 [Aspergillus steynii IBT 23096]PLB49937.1 hypothetical protein P170DRAFT_473515 [Aspergillus steynii IBT 23096]
MVFLGVKPKTLSLSWTIDPTANKELSPAAYYTYGGGVENENSSVGGGPPSGGPPSVTGTPSA